MWVKSMMATDVQGRYGKEDHTKWSILGPTGALRGKGLSVEES